MSRRLGIHFANTIMIEHAQRQYTMPFVKTVVHFAIDHSRRDAVRKYGVPMRTVQMWCLKFGGVPGSTITSQIFSHIRAHGPSSCRAIAQSVRRDPYFLKGRLSGLSRQGRLLRSAGRPVIYDLPPVETPTITTIQTVERSSIP